MDNAEKSAATPANVGTKSQVSQPDNRSSRTFDSSTSKEIVNAIVPTDRTPKYRPSSKQTVSVSSGMSGSKITGEQPTYLETGDCFLLLDLPNKCTVGLDTIALTVDGKNFKGFRDIPSGPHFLWISELGAISRCGYWFVTTEQGKVRVKRWDRRNETLSDASPSDVSERTRDIKQMYPHLVPHSFKGEASQSTSADQSLPGRSSPPHPDYTPDSLKIWHTLTSAITPVFLARVTGRKNISEWLIDTVDGAKDSLSSHETNQRTGRCMDFLFHEDLIHNQSLLHMAPGALEGNDTTPLILSLLNLDPEAGTQKPLPSPVRNTLPLHPPPLSPTISADSLLAEFQFAFLTGLHLGNHTCIEQWWNLLLKVILPAQRLFSLRPDLVASLLTVFYTQMVYNDKYIDHAPIDPSTSAAVAHTGTAHATSASMLDTIPRNKTRLKRALTDYRGRIEEASRKDGDTLEHTRAVEVFRQLEEWFLKYGWDLLGDEPTEEYDSRQERDKQLTRGAGGGHGDEDMQGGYDSEDETGEYAPVFVELDEDGREVGTVRWD